MGLLYNKSRGVIQLVRWNFRESALMFRLGLLKLAENIGPTNVRNPVAVLDTGRSGPGIFSKWIPAPLSETGQSALPNQILQPKISPLSDRAHLGRMLFKITFMAALFLGGYLTGRFAILDRATTADANANQATAEPAPPEPPSPLVWVSQVTAVLPETSAARAPLSVVDTPKPVSAPIRDARPLNSDEVREVQAWLNAFGFDAGSLDGFAGPQTTAAVKRYRAARQMEETGTLDRSVLQQVRQQVGQSSR